MARAEVLLNEKLKEKEKAGAAARKPRDVELRKERIAAKLLRGSSRKLWR